MAAPATWPFDRVGQRSLVDDAASGHVDDANARLGLGQELGVDQPHRVWRLGDVQGHEIRNGHQLVERDQVHVHLARPFGRDERVVRDESHPERAGALRNQFSDAPEPDDPEGLVAELDTGPT